MPYTTSLPESAGHGNFDPAYAGMVDSATDQKMTIQLFPPGKPSPESPPQQVSLQRPVGHSGANPLQSYLQTSQGSCMTLQAYEQFCRQACAEWEVAPPDPSLMQQFYQQHVCPPA